MEDDIKEYIKEYILAKVLKRKSIYGATVFFTPIIPLVFMLVSIAVIVQDVPTIADRVFGKYSIDIGVIVSMIGMSLTYFSILLVLMKYSYDKHKIVINEQKMTKLIFKKNPFHGVEFSLAALLVLSIIEIVDGIMKSNLNSVAFNILTIGFDVTIYCISYIIFSNVSTETLYYIFVFRPMVNMVRSFTNTKEDKYINDCFKKIDEIVEHICYDEEKEIYIAIFKILLEDLSKIRNWKIYENICKRVRKINEALDEHDIKVLQLNKMLINYFEGLKNFERENAIKVNKRHLKAIKSKHGDAYYDGLKSQLDGYCQSYTKYFDIKYYPNFAHEVVGKFKVAD